VMKGVILSICPAARLVDLSHQVPPQDILAGALILRQAAPYFPPGTIHLAVVDPGVGGNRRPVAVRIGQAIYVLPDNGLITGVCPPQSPPDGEKSRVSAVHLNRPAFWRSSPAPLAPPQFGGMGGRAGGEALSATFHGRDIFAPVAAHLAAGASLLDVGEMIDPAGLVRFPWPAVTRTPADGGWTLTGEVIYIDHFGNLITNIAGSDLTGPGRVWVADRPAGPLRRTYADGQPGELIAYVGSSGLLEIAIVNGNAAATIGAGRGTMVCYHNRPLSTDD